MAIPENAERFDIDLGQIAVTGDNVSVSVSVSPLMLSAYITVYSKKATLSGSFAESELDHLAELCRQAAETMRKIRTLPPNERTLGNLIRLP